MNTLLTILLIFFSFFILLVLYCCIELKFSDKVLGNALKITFGKNWKNEYKNAIFNIIANNRSTDYSNDGIDSIMEVYDLIDDGIILVLTNGMICDLVKDHVRMSLIYSERIAPTDFEKQNLIMNSKRILKLMDEY